MKQILNSKLTLYVPTEEGEYVKRTVTSVMADSKETIDAGTEADICIPLYFKRGLKYVPLDSFDPKKISQFTVFIGQELIIGKREGNYPPNDALIVTSLSIRTIGSRRLHHLRIHASSKPPKEDTYYE